MWQKEIIVQTTANAGQIWKLWSDVANWKDWDNEIEYAELSGKFEVGSTGVLKPKGGPKTRFKILDCQPEKTFTDRSYLPLTKMDFTHEFRQGRDGNEIVHRIKMTGLLTFLFSKVIGNKIIAELPKAMKKLTELAEKS